MIPDFKELENLNKEHCGIMFIKHYEVLNVIKFTPSQRKLIELVLSFQSNGQSFQMRYKKIAQRIGGSPNSISTYVKDLKKMGYLITDHRKNKNMAGSKTSLKVDTNFLLERVRSNLKKTETLIDKTDAEISGPEGIIKSTHVDEKKDKIIPTEEYPFRIEDINPNKMILRYADDNQYYRKIIKDYDKYWVKNGQGVMSLTHLIEFLNAYDKDFNSIPLKNYIDKVLSGVFSDYADWQKQKGNNSSN